MGLEPAVRGEGMRRGEEMGVEVHEDGGHADGGL